MSSMAQKATIMARLQAPETSLPCPDCAAIGVERYYEPDVFDTIRLPLLDDKGEQVLDKEGRKRHTVVRMRHHVLKRSVLDPTGLVPAACAHGLKEHPDPAQQAHAGRIAVSWIRSRYVKAGGKTGTTCVVCEAVARGDTEYVPPADFYGAPA